MTVAASAGTAGMATWTACPVPNCGSWMTKRTP